MQNSIFLSREEGFYNARIKYYPTAEGDFKAWETVVFDRSVFNPDKLELFVSSPSRFDEATEETFAPITEQSDEVGKTNKCSSRRARVKCFDYMMCNPDLNMFVTLTFAPSAVRRDVWGDIVQHLNRWLDNRVRRCGLKYILVPEHHTGETYDKRGRARPADYIPGAIHFHGLMNESALELVNSGHFRNGKTIYNISDYPFGWTTAIRRGASDVDVTRTSKYIFKYMTKEEGRIGGRYYLHGGKLASPKYVYYNAEGLDGLPVRSLECGLAFARVDNTTESKTTFSRLSSDFFKNSSYCKLE